MQKNRRWKSILIAAVTAVSALYLAPSFIGEMPEDWKNILPSERIHFGLDLQGGMHLVLGVDVKKAVDDTLQRSARDFIKSAADKKITVRDSRAQDNNIFSIFLGTAADLDKARALIKSEFPNMEAILREGAQPEELSIALKGDEVKYIREHVVQQALETIRNRIDQFGVAEPVIQKQGVDQIVVQLPGVKDPQRALDIIGKTAQLEFKLVDDASSIIASLIKDPKALPEGVNVSYDTVEDRGGRAIQVPYLFTYNKEALDGFLAGKIPPTHQVIVTQEIDREKKSASGYRTYLLRKDVSLSGDTLVDARVKIDTQMGEPYVSIRFNTRGARLFEEITGAHVGERLAIVLDDMVYSAPRVKSRIGGGNAIIEGHFNEQSAHDLSIVLRAGALPAPVTILQKFTVGPTLGKDSIHDGITSALIGGAFVILFMILYYRLSGALADVSVILNIFFLLAAFSALRATLTLPGIAGIILSMGMGVDSNILNFERIREEIKLGKTPRAAVEGGFDKSFYTIIDSHVTTLITAAVLFQFGTGPIKGFAVSLFLGVTINLFTSLICTRLFLDYVVSTSRDLKLSFMEILYKPTLDFISKRNYAFAFSGALLALGILSFLMIVQGKANMGIEFSGGTFLQVQSTPPLPIDKVREMLSRNNIHNASLQELPKVNRILIKIKKSESDQGRISDSIFTLLKKEYPTHVMTLETANDVGPAIGKNLQRDAILATIIAMVAILIYIAWRFEWIFGVTAAIATFHDVLAVLGIVYLLGKEIDLLIISALLTIAGYSLTDTVVVFDRVRENLRKRGGSMGLSDLINLSINEVLSRTIITSLTTFLASIALLLFGGMVLRDFALALSIGIVIGTYSSIYIACALILVWMGDKGRLFTRKT